MNLVPLYDKIVVKLDDKQEVKSKTGLVYQKNLSISSDTTTSAKVVAVGQGRLLTDGSLRPLTVKIGDKVLFNKIQGDSYNDGVNDYTIISESNVIAIIKEDTNENN